jgi:hypothetical protein
MSDDFTDDVVDASGLGEVIDTAGRAKEVVNTGRGIAAVAGHISKARQEKIDKGMDLFEEIGRGLKREERLASRQVTEVVDDFAAAGSLFLDAILDPEGFGERLKKGSDT